MSSILYLDLETVPTKDQAIIDEITASIQPPGNISKAETIATWNAEKRPEIVKDKIHATGLDGTYGSIVCIGWAFDDEEPRSICKANELDILVGFKKVIDEQNELRNGPSGGRYVEVVGHNIHWDLRFLWQRYIVNNIAPPSCIPFSTKRWDSEFIGDTMTRWNPEREKRISLDNLCRALRIESSKGDMDGSMVAEYAAQGRYEDIADYCKKDVIATRECYLRMRI